MQGHLWSVLPMSAKLLVLVMTFASLLASAQPHRIRRCSGGLAPGHACTCRSCSRAEDRCFFFLIIPAKPKILSSNAWIQAEMFLRAGGARLWRRRPAVGNAIRWLPCLGQSAMGECSILAVVSAGLAGAKLVWWDAHDPRRSAYLMSPLTESAAETD